MVTYITCPGCNHMVKIWVNTALVEAMYNWEIMGDRREKNKSGRRIVGPHPRRAKGNGRRKTDQGD